MISANIVKELRDKTGAGMMDCKKALTEAAGDMEKAIEYLRKHGIAKAEKKAGRATNEGKVFSLIKDGKAVQLEVLCETDFVATNEKFINYITGVAERALALPGDGCVTEQVCANEKDSLTEMIAKIGENMMIRRCAKWDATGTIGSYTHLGGKIGVLVEVTGTDDAKLLNEIGMHIAAFRPAYICSKCVPEEVIAKEKEIAAAQLSGKPANIIDKILAGKIAKYYTEVCLVDQPWIMDDKTSLAKLYPNVKVLRFLRWEVGEEL
ncbi:MAG: translation elongation factor Ts [Victivallaceae bacterium]|nr:translation elongation factor Ts [Victivallaceae bacterium]